MSRVASTVTIPDGARVRYRQYFVKCGLRSCPCYADKTRRHGPYWYAHWNVNGPGKPWRSKYIGKSLPTGIVVETKDPS